MSNLTIQRHEFLTRVEAAGEVFAARIDGGAIIHNPGTERGVRELRSPEAPPADFVILLVAVPSHLDGNYVRSVVIECLSEQGLASGNDTDGWLDETGGTGPLEPSSFTELYTTETGFTLHHLGYSVPTGNPEEAWAWFGDELYTCDSEACGNAASYDEIVERRERNKGSLVVRGLAALAGVGTIAAIVGLLTWVWEVSRNLIYLSFAGLLVPTLMSAAGQGEMTCFKCRKAQMIPVNSPRGQYLMRART